MSLTSFAAYTDGHIRLTILEFLRHAPAYSANDAVLRSACDAIGLPSTRSKIRAELVWLEEQGLLRRAEFPGDVTVATITERGEEVAAGRSSYPGVEKPAPRI